MLINVAIGRWNLSGFVSVLWMQIYHYIVSKAQVTFCILAWVHEIPRIPRLMNGSSGSYLGQCQAADWSIKRSNWEKNTYAWYLGTETYIRLVRKRLAMNLWWLWREAFVIYDMIVHSWVTLDSSDSRDPWKIGIFKSTDTISEDCIHIPIEKSTNITYIV